MIIHNLTDAEFVAWHGLPATVGNETANSMMLTGT
jgi:hypothetical protein